MAAFEQVDGSSSTDHSAAAAAAARGQMLQQVANERAVRAAGSASASAGAGRLDGAALPDRQQFSDDVSERVMFAAMLNDSRQHPERRWSNEAQLDRLLDAADRRSDAALLRRETRLKATGGDGALAAYANAEKDFTRTWQSIGGENLFRSAWNYTLSLIDGKPASDAVIRQMNETPDMKAAAERLAKAWRDPAMQAGLQIKSEAAREGRDSVELRRQYAEMLAETGRSGKALSLIVQASELEKQFK